MIQTTPSSLLSILKRRKWLGISTFGSVIIGAIAYLALVPSEYKVRTRLMINAQEFGVSELGQSLTELSDYQFEESNPIATQAELIKSKKILGEAVQNVFPQGLEQTNPPFSMKNLKKNLNIKIIPGTNILEINFKHQDPEISAKLINEITQELVRENRQSIRSQATSVRKFLEQEIPKQQEITEAATLAENQYRKKYGLVDLEQQTKNLVNSIEAQENQKRSLISKIKNNQQKSKELQRIIGLQDTKNAYLAGRVAQDEVLQTLQDKLVDLEVKIAHESSRLTENHPTLLALLEEQDKMINLYQAELKQVSPNYDESINKKVASDEDSLSQTLTSQFIISQVEGLALQEQLQTIKNQQEQLKNRLEKLPNQQQSLSKLVRKQEASVNNLKFLEEKLGEARLAEAQLLSNIRILELAEVDLSNKTPSKKALLVLAGFFGIFFTIGIILLQEILDNTLYEDFDLETWLKVPVLNKLPYLPEISLNPELDHLFLDKADLIEPYRRLLKRLKFSSKNNLKSIVVSSALSGEGKSVIASHLGTVAAMLSHRTLIIDANLYNPQQHKFFDIPYEPGLSDILDDSLSPIDLIQATRIDNLSILPCGQLKSQPSHVLESKEIKYLLKELKEYYDLVIIDTSSINNYADAITLSELTETFILIARLNFTCKNILKETIMDVQKSGVSVTGLVVNAPPYTPKSPSLTKKKIQKKEETSNFFILD